MTQEPRAREVLREAARHALLAPSEHNAQPWRFRLHGAVLDLRADRTRRLPATDEAAHNLLLGCGCALHHLRVALAAAGREADVRRGNDEDPEHPLARVRLGGPTTPDPRTRRWFGAMPGRRTDRRRFSGQEVGPEVVEALAEAARSCGGTLFLATGSVRRAIVEAAAEADRAMRARLDYAAEMQHWTRRYAGAHDGIPASSRPDTPAVAYGDVEMRWMPPGTLDRPRAGPGARDASQILLLAAPSADTVSLVRAGEALSAVLLEAEALGLAVTPFTAPFEEPAVEARIRHLGIGAHRIPVIALRVGRRLPGAATIPPTPRRPLHAVLTEDP
ncbi:Acg family FMN-binding oxidoreductase [Actinomycetospora sp. TBRC 11914]|uniref:Acg family FMN-binding oxidoreductase n=1 Tax=Actinomycetospora sp. TBRC 11914 TaxID=2729387 RepID=UPI00145E330C|nr:nitroreductase family protein [Actinomycetospora sp. TBRC 11914]NMO89453.1 NAD(P)H nitroreductase [Actinomycetospora sp. TBRC 11914]